MSGQPVNPAHVYKQMAPHLPAEQFPAGPACQCGHGHAHQPVQQVVIKQADPWARYLTIGFAGAGIALMLLAGLIVALIALGLCALCVAVAVRALRGMFDKPKKDG